MPIKYYLQPNPITPDPNDQSARVASNQSLDINGIVSKILKRGTTVTEPDIRAVLNIFFDVVTDEVADGNTVLLPLVNIRPGVTGVFKSATDTFDDSRHIKKANLSGGVLLNQKISNAVIEKITGSQPIPALIEYMDVNTSTANSILTPGGIGQIVGEELKFNPGNPAEGLFFINGSGAATQVAVFATRTEGKLMFSIPASLTKGNYTVELRKGYGNSAALRNGALSEFLQVA